MVICSLSTVIRAVPTREPSSFESKHVAQNMGRVREKSQGKPVLTRSNLCEQCG